MSVWAWTGGYTFPPAALLESAQVN